ncbi:hypothetical protein C0Q70_12774 [Pomacea canaliculata]|uniref:BUD13 homolog n=1 Tax=Pomacea canaliculata TaxID=400727 RepID=A0A2T7P2H6_POMCA|nr:hypothetical protein C0Q70_12774 [Pomacea canaliculata]
MATLSKEEYLKRYLSNEVTKDKKKKRKKISANIKKTNVKIIDDDIDFSSLDKSVDIDIASKDYGVIAVGSNNLAKTTEGSDIRSFDQDYSCKNKRHYDSDSDHSPLRKKAYLSGDDSDTSTSRPLNRTTRQFTVTACDTHIQQVRKHRHDSDSDESFVRKKRHDSDSDHSPPRKQKHCHGSPSRKSSGHDQQQIQKRQGTELQSDSSVPRRKPQESDSDQSPPRRKENESDSDQSPPRKRDKGSDSDQSPRRRRDKGSDSDQSPPRKRNSDQSLSWKQKDAKPSKTLGGAKAGLSTAQEMKKEAQKLKQKEDAMFQKIDKDALGKDAGTVFRDKSGRKRDLAAEKEKDEEEAKRKSAMDQKYKEWGQGLKQKEMQEQVMQTYLHEMAKPLARYKDDEDLDRMMRDLDREGDPMAAFLKKKKTKEESGNGRPQYKGPAPPPNRFGIMPGYRWDGVNRSNGFEKQLFSKLADKKSIQEEAYKWSTEDM